MKYTNPYFIPGILILLLVGQSYAASGQTVSIANHVVVNEVEIRPSGDFTTIPSQWVELYNPTNAPVNIGGWTIGATSGLKQIYTIPSGTIIQSQQFIVYHYVPLWFPTAGAVVQLKDSGGIIVDQTPSLTDQQGDGNTWQRIYDGYNTGSQNDWILKGGTPGFSNGKPQIVTTTNALTLSISTDKQNYVFGNIVNINGQVSQIVKNPAVTSIPQTVNIILSGPNGFQKTFSLYPGTDLKFSTYQKLDQVLGFNEGTYKITASYGGMLATTSFSLGSVAFTPTQQAAPTTLSLSLDKSSYHLLEPIVLQGIVSKVIPLTPAVYKVFDPTNVVVYQGTLFPDTEGKLTTVNQYQRSAANSGLLINSVNPIYGMYKISVTYGDAANFTAFTLVPTGVQTDAIIVSTDKKAYAPGETVVISGSTKLMGLQNLGLNPSLQILQTSVSASAGTQTSGNRGVVPNTANVKTLVTLQSDNTFSYKFSIPGTLISLGNYRITISLPQGVAQTDFVVVQNPADYTSTVSSSPFSLNTDKNSYALGDHITISGHIFDPIKLSTQNAGTNVRIQIFNSTGGAITTGSSFINNALVPTSTPLIFYTFPDANGIFQTTQILQSGIYHPGTYKLKALYSNLTTTATFTIYDPLGSGSLNQITASTDKKVYDVGDTVQLNGKLSALTATNSFTLTLTKPSGSVISFPLQVNNGQFSWSWVVPNKDTVGSALITTDRSSSSVIDPTRTVYGIYRIKISSDQVNSELFFQVSANPQPGQALTPIAVQTDKAEYLSTDVARIWGQVIPVQNSASQEANAVVQVLIYSDNGQQVYRGNANVNLGGQYYVTIPFHTGIWKTGTYKIYAEYMTNRVISSFKVTDTVTASSSGKLQLFITTDTDKYLPGQTVLITGRTSSIISIDRGVDLAFGLKNDTIITEGEVSSKKGVLIQKATSPLDQFGSFRYDYKIPNNAPIGKYTIIALVPFGSYTVDFDVVNQLPIQNIPSTNQTQVIPSSNGTQTPPVQTSTPSTIGPVQKHTISANSMIEKHGKISDSVIPITFATQSVGNATYSPRQLDGLLRINPGNEDQVSIKVSSQDGTCIIGQSEDCLVTKSTVQSGMLYQTVKINGADYLVGYSGGGIRVQQFSIIPANVNDVIPDGNWSVSIIKKDQVTRFYYQVTYNSK